MPGHRPVEPLRGNAYVGCSGWSYSGWRGVVYERGLPQGRWFARYAEMFGTVEVNNTFYRLPPEHTFDHWAGQAPPGFVYAVKLNRYGTHLKRLLGPEEWLPSFLSRVGHLGPSLGPVLAQLPPNLKKDLGRLEAFCECARRCGHDVAKRRPGGASVRWVVEARHPSWLHDDVFSLLAKYRFALCAHDLIEGHPWLLTTDWGYARFHGPGGAAAKYRGQYTGARLRRPAQRLQQWADGGADVYAYFNNDPGGASVRDATWLRQRLMS